MSKQGAGSPLRLHPWGPRGWRQAPCRVHRGPRDAPGALKSRVAAGSGVCGPGCRGGVRRAGTEVGVRGGFGCRTGQEPLGVTAPTPGGMGPEQGSKAVSGSPWGMWVRAARWGARRQVPSGWGLRRPLISFCFFPCVGREPRPTFHAPVFYLCCPGGGAVWEAR